ncbi:tRNA preQ1(34) S-adenosylmethionine ribosyltransferase-isomerase QueA [Candidatus Poriferisodalis sp.]|uniref:tRNA preQ1(34) S-adenosylmethionine ribosyltransferase-isomerase QueA n=1 Tax=Candidatus Poriferisodalis sp. TaxID=3101277 RepID=UPI003B01980C
MSEFDYDLPASAVAHVPVEPRDAARLLIDRGPREAPEHGRVSDLPMLLRAGDLLVVNETRVMPARLPLRKRTGGAAEVLLLAPLAAATPASAPQTDGPASPSRSDVRHGGDLGWAALVRPSRRIRDGTVLESQHDPRVRVVVGERLDTQRRAVQVFVEEVPVSEVSQTSLLDRAGEPPLPPYIDPVVARDAIARRLGADAARAALADRYQTVYARSQGSAAAPTAGLHLTQRVLDGLRSAGVGVATVDLTVGLATFAPVTATYAEAHEMHAEHFRVPAATLAACAAAKRVVAVGTTTVRALEAAARTVGNAGAVDVCGWTDLFLRRGAEFHVVDAMLTNFHLPRSSLLLLIDAFVGPRWRQLYETALAEGYRFLSFGDAMLLSRSDEP